MRAILQRVTRAAVSVDNSTVGEIGKGWLVLFGVGQSALDSDLEYIVDKTVNMRAFADENGKMNRSVLEIGGEVLVVSQFTLYADCRKGRRPSFTSAGDPATSEQWYNRYIAGLRAAGLKVATGRFGASMQVSLCNDGPVTFFLDSSKLL